MLKYTTFRSASWATKAINLAIKGQNEDWLGSLTPAGLVGFFSVVFKTGKWLKLFFISLLTIPWVKSKLDLGAGIKCTARFASGVEGPGVLGSFVQCSVFLSAYLREKNRHSLCLELPSFPSFGVADSTVAPTLRKWDKAIRENRLRGFFSPRKYVCILTSHLIFPAYFIRLPKKSLMHYYIFEKMLKCLF